MLMSAVLASVALAQAEKSSPNSYVVKLYWMNRVAQGALPKADSVSGNVRIYREKTWRSSMPSIATGVGTYSDAMALGKLVHIQSMPVVRTIEGQPAIIGTHTVERSQVIRTVVFEDEGELVLSLGFFNGPKKWDEIGTEDIKKKIVYIKDRDFVLIEWDDGTLILAQVIKEDGSGKPPSRN